MLLFLVSAAHAFCGTFVGSDGALLANRASQVVLARVSDSVTLTLAVDYTGDASEFALLMPVPSVLTAENVSTVDPALLERVADWSSPREVAYTCDDLVTADVAYGGCSTPLATGCAAEYSLGGGIGDDGEDAEGTVTVEASFSEAGYEFVVLSTQTAGALQTWLDDNGYALPAGGDAILQEYIDAGVYFLAAKVALDAAPTGQAWLPPIQLTYESDTLSLPIRIGTISADGPQEVLIYVLHEGGAVAISNYPEVAVDDECLRSMDQDFGTYYADALDDALGGEAGWIEEYSWSLTANCDPCTATTGLTPAELEALGFAGYHGWFTRLRMRYSPEQATQDLAMYDGGDTGTPSQIRYIQDAPELRDFYPVCGEGVVPGDGTCIEVERSAPFGCAAAGAPVAAAMVLLSALLRRRR